MELQLRLLDTFPARGSDDREYKVCAYDRLRRDDSVHDGQDHWLPTGVTELRLASGERVDAQNDGSMLVVPTGVRLTRAA